MTDAGDRDRETAERLLPNAMRLYYPDVLDVIAAALAVLTHLAATLPPRIGHAIARLLGIDAAYRMFCPNPCCTDRRTL